MAEGKKSFVAYCDWGDIFDELNNEEAGLLAKHLFDYVRDKNPVAKDQLTKMMFIQIKQSLKRDLVKYDKYIDKQKINGAKGGRPKKTQITQPFIEKPKKADSVSVSVSDTVSDSVNDNDILLEKETKELFKTWLDYRKEIKKPIKSDKTKIALANKILKEGFKKSSEIINNSIECGYQGLFWDKFTPQNKQPLSQMDSGVRKKLEKYS